MSDPLPPPTGGPLDDHEGFCVTVVRPGARLSASEVALRLGGDPATLKERSHRDGDDDVEDLDDGTDPLWDDDGPPRYLLSEQDGAWVVFEDNGFQGSRPEVLRALSTDADVVGYFVNHANGANQLSRAGNGEVLVMLDVCNLLDPAYRGGADIHALDDYLDPLVRINEANEHGQWEPLDPAAVRVVEQVGRVRLDQRWFSGPSLLLVAEELPDALPSPPRGLYERLASPDRGVRWRALREAIRKAVTSTGLADDPDVAAALAEMDDLSYLVTDEPPAPVWDPSPAADNLQERAQAITYRYQDALPAGWKQGDADSVVRSFEAARGLDWAVQLVAYYGEDDSCRTEACGFLELVIGRDR